MIQRRKFSLITMLLLITALFIPFAFSYRTYASPAAQVEILSYSDYYDSLGWLHIVGEVKNGLDSRIHFVKIIATYYDAEGTVVETSFTYTKMDLLLSGQKSPFEILLTSDVVVDHYRLAVSYDTTIQYPYREFEILSHSSHTDSLGWLHVVGELENVGAQDATFVEVICTFYDSGGTVTATAFTFTDPEDLSAGQVAPFEIILINKALSSKVNHYSLQVQCNEYTTPPDETPPSISNVKRDPQSPKPGEQVTVTATITDVASGVEETTLYYRLDSGAWVSKSMSKTDNIWSATIPAQGDGVTVDYYIKAFDGVGNRRDTSIYSYTVMEEAEEEGKECIIATATYGSELAPEVRFLRNFRDSIVLSTFAGGQFMRVFNAWYYSFSPSVACFISGQPLVKMVMKGVLYPLIGILHLSSMVCSAFSFSPELGVGIAGLVASSLIGVVYFAIPATMILVTIRRFKKKTLNIGRLKLLAIPWLISLVLMLLGEIATSPVIMMAATASFVLITLSSSATVVASKIAQYFPS